MEKKNEKNRNCQASVHMIIVRDKKDKSCHKAAITSF